MFENERKITIFAGHYGSGKTNLAVNYALYLKEHSDSVILCDMDVVNPYFRTKDSAGTLQAAGVRLISPEYANSNLDLPVIPAEARAMFSDNGAQVVVDVGGDDAGALALGQFSDNIGQAGYGLLLVVNRYRYLTREAEELADVRREIEAASHLRFTGIVNNSNLGRETTAELVEASFDYARRAGELLGLPVLATSYREDLRVRVPANMGFAFPIRIFTKEGWKID